MIAILNEDVSFLYFCPRIYKHIHDLSRLYWWITCEKKMVCHLPSAVSRVSGWEPLTQNISNHRSVDRQESRGGTTKVGEKDADRKTQTAVEGAE